MPNKTKKNFESIFTKTRIYLVIIATILIVLCIQNIIFIIPSLLLYGILLAYTFWTNNKNKTELDKHIKEITFNVDTIAKNTMINSPFPLVIAEEDGNLTWKSSTFVTEFGNIEIKSILADLIKEVKLDLGKEESDDQKKDKQVLYKQLKIGKKDYQVIIETIASKSRNKKKREVRNACYVSYR